MLAKKQMHRIGQKTVLLLRQMANMAQIEFRYTGQSK
jgi:hypothetical protein